MTPLLRLLLVLHITAGTTALLVGLVPMLGRKGGRAHARLGRVYVACMVGVALSAALLCLLQPFSTGRLFLGCLAVFSFYLAFSGWRSARTHGFAAADRLLAFVTLAVGLAMIGAGLRLGHVLFVFFGAVTCTFAGRDLLPAKPPTTPVPWLFRHITRMGGSYISAFTAFVVVNMGRFLPPQAPGWLHLVGWIAPSVIGGVLIGRAVRHYRSRYAGRNVKTLTAA